MGKGVFLTGRPGIGKTTVLMNVIELLRREGVTVGGMTSSEIRVQGVRVGFEVRDLSSGRTGILAHVDQKHGPRVGKYRVNLRDLDEIGVTAIVNALESNDVVAVDEVAAMELYSDAFQKAVQVAVSSGKPLIGTVHAKAGGAFTTWIKRNPSIEVVRVTGENRNEIHNFVARKLLEHLRA